MRPDGAALAVPGVLLQWGLYDVAAICGVIFTSISKVLRCLIVTRSPTRLPHNPIIFSVVVFIIKYVFVGATTITIIIITHAEVRRTTAVAEDTIVLPLPLRSPYRTRALTNAEWALAGRKKS